MSFNIRPPATFLDSLTNAAVDYLVYVSKPNTDPTDATQRVILRDQNTGEQVDNPFIIGSSGYAKNANGNIIIPYCDELRVAIRFESADGGIQWEARNVESDAYGISGGEGLKMMVDQTLDNFDEALATDLTEFDLVFIQSETPDWRDTADGPQNPYYAYKTGSIGDPSTGTAADFYDANGNQWKLVLQPYVYADLDIDQTISGRKTFEDIVIFEDSTILRNSIYSYISGANDLFDGPGAVRFRVDGGGNYILEKRSADGEQWVNVEGVLSDNETSRAFRTRVIHTDSCILNNDRPLIFRNSGQSAITDNAFQLSNDDTGFFRISQVQGGELRARLIFRPEGDDSVSFFSNGAEQARIESSGASLSGATSVVTREKGDARYLTKGEVVDFFLSGDFNSGIPSSWAVVYEDVSPSADKYTITHNLNKQLRPVITYNTLGDATEETIRPPYVLSTDANSFVLIGRGDTSGGGRASLNVLVKI